jgi:hypothetical protein
MPSNLRLLVWRVQQGTDQITDPKETMGTTRFAFLMFILLVAFYINRQDVLHPLWDLRVYAGAVQACQSGQSAYALSDGFLFVYPPFSVKLACALSPQALSAVLLSLYAVAVAAFAWQLRHLSRAVLLEGWVAFFAMGALGVNALASGNVTVFMHMALCAVLLAGLGAEHWGSHSSPVSQASSPGLLHASPRISPWFWPLLALCALIKPYFLAYALVPVALKRSRAALLSAAAVMVLVAGGWWLDRVLHPQMFEEFLAALRAQTVQKGDMGLSLSSVLSWYHLGLWGVPSHLLVWGGLVALRLGLERKSASSTTDQWLFWVVAAIELNPRVKSYDLAVLMLLCTISQVRNLSPGRFVWTQLLVWLTSVFSSGIGALGKGLTLLGVAHTVTTPAPYAYLTAANYLAFAFLALQPAWRRQGAQSAQLAGVLPSARQEPGSAVG